MLKRHTEEERRKLWLEIKAKGRRRFVWRSGVLGWGLPVFAIWTPLMLFFGPSTHRASLPENVGIIVFSLLIWMLAGYLYGHRMWKTLHKRYDA
jgi:hypothetical protein